jgi:hypothetical protein
MSGHMNARAAPLAGVDECLLTDSNTGALELPRRRL